MGINSPFRHLAMKHTTPSGAYTEFFSFKLRKIKLLCIINIYLLGHYQHNTTIEIQTVTRGSSLHRIGGPT